ncbi:DUF3078 domain-containing protein [Draconibacterium sp. IB214405]|uniref:DUF3078 domain-containing protein n=1 Tax=Draconibacterium sp. IB214405 TaxID=3097352 RepID=UPI002A16A3B1|nr:DUF3078 domain-containing protein [Draconibacterium sp. IB214405]MDX8340044.1 DUF3078 domain-containing protein [Draconibacterium sp. IB214405]
MKKLLILFLLIPAFAFAQEEKKDTLWTTSGSTTLNFSQVSLSNWAAGGKSSMSGVFMVNYAANYKKDKLSWDNTFDFRYGFLKEEDQDLRKSDDMIDISSKLGIEAKKNWYYSALLGFKSQFAAGYDYPDTDNPISKFMAPGYLNLGLGMDYKTDEFSLMMAPVSGKFTFVTDNDLSDEGAFGVEEGNKLRAELGATVKAQFKKDIWENVTLDTKVDLFSNYLDQPKNIDVDWTFKIIMKVNDYLSANLITQMIYDNDVKIQGDDENLAPSPALQFMESFGVGLTFKF